MKENIKPTIYLETTIPSYLGAQPARDFLALSRQKMTMWWWENRRENFELFTSGVVEKEISMGDEGAVTRRRFYLEGIAILGATEEVEKLAQTIRKKLDLPERAATDALHIAFSVVHDLNFLLTWNCTHIANPFNQEKIRSLCRNAGFNTPVICTPADFMEVDPNDLER